MLEAPPLARALYRHSEIGQHIPATLYAAVAEVLAWVYQLRRWRREGGLIPKNLNVYRCRKHWILQERVTLMANLASCFVCRAILKIRSGRCWPARC